MTATMRRAILVMAMLLLGTVSSRAQKDDDASGAGGGGGMPNMDGFSGLGGNKVCDPFRCTKGYAPVQRWPMKLTSPGCNNIGGGISVMSFSKKEDEGTRKCCDQRNACYQICGTSRKSCDDEFKKCSDDACAAIDDGDKRSECEKNAQMNQMMINLSDCRQFDEGQRSGCECTEKEKAKERRKTVIRAFYKKFNPDGLDKVDKLAEKVETTAKMGGLFRKLVAKYPQGIKRVKDPQQEYMEKLMKDTETMKGKEKPGEEEGGNGGTDEGVDDLDDERTEL